MSVHTMARLGSGCTAGQIDLHRDKETGVFIITLLGDANPDNRFSTAFSRGLHHA